jgi:hypothetical protein
LLAQQPAQFSFFFFHKNSQYCFLGGPPLSEAMGHFPVRLINNIADKILNSTFSASAMNKAAAQPIGRGAPSPHLSSI